MTNTNCRNCGAPHLGNCEYCGTVYEEPIPDGNRYTLADSSGHQTISAQYLAMQTTKYIDAGQQRNSVWSNVLGGMAASALHGLF